MTTIQATLGLSQETITSVHEILHKTLANQSLYQIKLKQFHWNVKGAHFSEYHELFDDMYTSLTEVIDDTAERIRALGIDCI
jgi:starvation-inducible DNA-binding protein